MILRSTVLFFVLDTGIPLFLLWIGLVKGLPILSIFSKTSFALWFFSIAFFSFVFYWCLFLNSLFLFQFIHSVMSDFALPRTAALQGSLSIASSQSSLRLLSIESVMLSNHLILCRPLLLLPSVFPSIRVFTSVVSSLHQVAEVLEFQLQHQFFQRTFKTDFL